MVRHSVAGQHFSGQHFSGHSISLPEANGVSWG
jgi:hypothetical protein